MWRCGLAFGPESVSETVRGGFSVTACPPVALHVWHALTLLSTPNASRSQCDTAQRVASAALSALPDDGPLQQRMTALASTGGAAPVPTAEAPIRASAFLQRFAVSTHVNQLQHLPPARVKRHPAADVFPGRCAIPTAARVFVVKFDAKSSSTRWNSTGLYVAAGEPVTVRLLSGSAAGLSLRIGCHSDSLLHHDSWSRIPCIDLEHVSKNKSSCVQLVCLIYRHEHPQSIVLDTSGRFTICSAFGGLLYVVVPDNQHSVSAVLECTGGVVEAPFFQLGRDSSAEWQRRRHADAPFGELASRKVVLSVPSQHLRQLDDPTALLQFWDRVSDACADLASLPRDRACPWRYVADVQISAGYVSGHGAVVEGNEKQQRVHVFSYSRALRRCTAATQS